MIMSTQQSSSPGRPSVLAATAPSRGYQPVSLQLAESEDGPRPKPTFQPGVTQMSNKGTAIHPFTYRASDAQLDELRRRILATVWPERETVADASQGVQLATTQKLAKYWATDYD